ncbi:MAG: hypothetical protein K1060chlam5_00209 [Candidatus Anoxychlamydiales bacterium]|nr:hypothetical protein [Candidatus Anoxychlamydiales bacterium]
MNDEYKELIDTLNNFIEKLEEFNKTKNDYLKLDIRAIGNKIDHLSKILSDNIAMDSNIMFEKLDLYLSTTLDEDYKKLLLQLTKIRKKLFEL